MIRAHDCHLSHSVVESHSVVDYVLYGSRIAADIGHAHGGGFPNVYFSLCHICIAALKMVASAGKLFCRVTGRLTD